MQVGDVNTAKTREERWGIKKEDIDENQAVEKVGPKAAIVERMIQEEQEILKEKMKELEDKPKISKKKLRVMSRPSIAELKAVNLFQIQWLQQQHLKFLSFQSVSRPDVVEWHDVTSKDPKLLVNLKVRLYLDFT